MTDGGKPWFLHRWSPRVTAWVIGTAALVAGGSAAAVVATSASGPHPEPATAASKSALDTKSALDAILASHPDVAQPVADLISQGKLPQATYAGDNGHLGVPAGAARPSATPGAVPSFLPGPRSGDFSLLELASLALSQGCSVDQAPIAAAIGAAESAGNPGAQGDISLMDGTWDWSEGLWQIRGLKSERGSGGLRDSLANADPMKNANAMMAISSGCTDWTPWSTYNTGAYLSYLSLSKGAAEAATKYRQKTGSYPPVGAGAAARVPSSAPPTSTSPTATRRSGTGAARVSPSPTRSPSSGAHPSSPTPTKTSVHPSRSKSSTLPTKKPTLPVKVPTLPIKTPTLPLPLPTLPLPSLPGLP